MLALTITGYVLILILSENQDQIAKDGEDGEINHTKFCIITKKGGDVY